MKIICLRYILFISFLILAFSGCFPFPDHETSTRHIVGPFYLTWSIQPKEQVLIESPDGTGTNGTILINPTVFAIGNNDDFIIVKHHPDKEEEIRFRIFKETNGKGHFLLSNPEDSIYLSKEDSIYEENGKWYHISNGWNPPETLKPFKSETLFSIVDIRDYELQSWHGRDKVFTFNNEIDFKKKKQALGVPENLIFSVVDSILQ